MMEAVSLCSAISRYWSVAPQGQDNTQASEHRFSSVETTVFRINSGYSYTIKVMKGLLGINVLMSALKGAGYFEIKKSGLGRESD